MAVESLQDFICLFELARDQNLGGGGGDGGYLVYYSVTAGLRRPMKTLVRLF